MRFLKNKNVIVWIITFVISTALILVGYKITKNKYISLNGNDSAKEAVVEEIINRNENTYNDEKSIEVIFKAKLKSGKIVTASQSIDNYSSLSKQVSKGDKILVYENQGVYYFGDYVRINKIIVLMLIFFALLIILGGIKGLNTLVSLIFTCAAIFIFFLPSILSGYNIYLSAIITCVFVIIMTLLFINGLSKKTLTTILGCIFGVITAGIIFFIMNKVLYLTGVACEDELYLQMLDVHINLKAIIFAAIIISSMGAVMDVSMDISSSLYEIKTHKPNITFKEMLKSGLNIGRDIMGTMSNTLILAFIGKSLSTVLLIMTYASSLGEIMNKELIIINMLEALIGSLSILLTAPITSIICSYIYNNKFSFKRKKEMI